jgi:autotransporter family porin
MASKTISLDSAITVGSLNIGDTNGTSPLTLSNGLGNLTFNNSGSPSVITAIGRTNIISATTTLANDLNINVATTQLTYSGAISGAFNLVKSGSGALAFSIVTQNFSGSITVKDGSLRFSGLNPSVMGFSSLIMDSGNNNITFSLSNGGSSMGSKPITITADGTGTVTLNNNQATNVALFNSAMFIGKATTFGSLCTVSTGQTTFSGAISDNGSNTGLITVSGVQDNTLGHL